MSTQVTWECDEPSCGRRHTLSDNTVPPSGWVSRNVTDSIHDGRAGMVGALSATLLYCPSCAPRLKPAVHVQLHPYFCKPEPLTS